VQAPGGEPTTEPSPAAFPGKEETMSETTESKVREAIDCATNPAAAEAAAYAITMAACRQIDRAWPTLSGAHDPIPSWEMVCEWVDKRFGDTGRGAPYPTPAELAPLP
jgi:hypothetical protein